MSVEPREEMDLFDALHALIDGVDGSRREQAARVFMAERERICRGLIGKLGHEECVEDAAATWTLKLFAGAVPGPRAREGARAYLRRCLEFATIDAIRRASVRGHIPSAPRRRGEGAKGDAPVRVDVRALDAVERGEDGRSHFVPFHWRPLGPDEAVDGESDLDVLARCRTRLEEEVFPRVIAAAGRRAAQRQQELSELLGLLLGTQPFHELVEAEVAASRDEYRQASNRVAQRHKRARDALLACADAMRGEQALSRREWEMMGHLVAHMKERKERKDP